MEGLFPRRVYVKNPLVVTTPLGQLFAKKSVSTQSSISSLRDIADGDHPSSFSKKFPPNQEGYMEMHKTNLSDTDTGAILLLLLFFISIDRYDPEPSVYPSQPVRAAFIQPSDGEFLGDSADQNRPSNNTSAYPQPDDLSISTDNSVMRSQLFSSKLMAYNSDQAGLKPGDEGYSEPPEQNYAKCTRGGGFSDAASTETDKSVVPAKGKAPVDRPFSNPFVRMPGVKDTSLSEEETSRLSGDSFIVIPDSQESPPTFKPTCGPSQES